MRWTRWSALALVACSASLAVAALSCSPGAQPPANGAAAMSQVERGEYLVTIAGCNDCHTPGFLFGAPDFERTLSGSELGWQGPWGVSYARNLTPHETGLGAWSEDEIVNAIRAGTRPDGRQLLPPMPWQNFARMTDDDVYAIAAYLKSIPPIEHRVPDVVPPGESASGSIIVFPAPSAWDAPREGAAASH